MNGERLAGLSFDADSVAAHLAGYGIDDPVRDDAVYERAIPRALEVIEQAGARCTFFLIGSEAQRHPDVVREIVERGHEVASHSMTHRLPFATLAREAMEAEVAGSRRCLEQLSGRPVRGFRAPSWDISPTLLGSVARAGYVYDASAFHSVVLPFLRYSIARRSKGKSVRTVASPWRGMFGPSRPHEVRVNGSTLWEIPMATASWTGLPYYHTIALMLPARAATVLARSAGRTRHPITYQFHAVDFLGMSDDALDRRMARHPGMRLALSRKLSSARTALKRLSSGRSVIALSDLVARLDESDYRHATRVLDTTRRSNTREAIR